jgi:hypothetical protein
MSNVNNLNGVPNFGHGEAEVIPNDDILSALDDAAEAVNTKEEAPKLHRAKVKSAARKILGGKYQ